MLLLHVSPGADLPLYRQIMRGITDAIAGGQLRPGDQLPGQAELSQQLVIAPLTVKKAYDELEKLGYIEMFRGRGTFVRAELPLGASAERDARLDEAARALLSQAYLAGLDFPDVVALLQRNDRKLMSGAAGGPAVPDAADGPTPYL